MFMKRIYKISVYVVTLMLTLASLLSCRYDPLDSYSRVPPDRTGDSSEDKGGLGGAFASGFGTPESPYIIATAQHLANMPQGLSPEEMVYFRLSADIDMKDIPWVPLNNAEPYSLFVDFDGDGHVIRNLNCKGQNYSSFFGILCGECRNVGFLDAAISGSNASGIIAGYLGIRAPKSSNYVGSVKNCFVSGSVSGNPAGGIVGMSGTAYSPYSCQIDNCYSSARVSASGQGGGIVGNMLDGGIVTNVYATGRVSADRACGGIAGNLEGSSYLQNVVAWNSSVSGPKDNTGFVSGTKKVYDGACTYANTISELDNPDGKTDAELRAVVTGWGDPWAKDGSVANGYPAFNWLASRADVAEVCGHVKVEDPDAPITPEEINKGSGTESDPYILSTAGQLFNLKSVLKKGETVYVRLSADIDLRKQNWTPLNFEDPYDLGIHFDGGGHKILNFSCSGAKIYASFFGVLNGVCENVEFVDATVLGIAGNCGLLGGWTGTNAGIKALVSNVKANMTLTNEAAGEAQTGGLAGVAVNSEFKNCDITVNVTSDVVHNTQRASCGGIVGKSNAGVVISGCKVGGSVTNNKGKYTGGIIGWESGGDVSVTECVVTATVRGELERVGGIIGHFQGGALSGCEFSGNLSSASNLVGGIAGISGGVASIKSCTVSGEIEGVENCGGIIGKNENKLTVEDCIFSGKLKGFQRLGGIVGDLLSSSSVKNCFVSGAVDGWGCIGGIVGRACNGGWKAAGSDYYGNDIESCIVWLDNITATRPASDTNTKASSGAVVGFTATTNILKDCMRKSGMKLTAEFYSNIYDQENAGPSAPLVISEPSTSADYIIFPYHGKAASGSNASAVAQSLGWDASIWDFSKQIPSLKK